MAKTPAAAPAAGASGSKGKQRAWDLDTRSLDCPICLEQFTIPVFQCRNGHSACSACCAKLTAGCPTCSKPIGAIRNLAIERIIKSLQVDCKHAPHGCTATLRYNNSDEIEEHENKRCPYRPMLCPVQSPSQCVHIGPGVTIASHLAREHGVPVIENGLEAGRPAHITMRATCPMTMMKTEEAWLLVNCWAGRFQFGSYVFCSVYGNSTGRLLIALEIERVRLRNEERLYLTYTALQAEALRHSDLVMENITLEGILVGPYLNIPHSDEDWPELEFDLKVTVLRDDSDPS